MRSNLELAGGNHNPYLWFFLFSLGLLVCFTLPPFQAPDEAVHWQTAIHQFKGSQQSCDSADSLPELFEANRIIWRNQERFKWPNLEAFSETLQTCSTKRVSYASWFSYPSVALANLLMFFRDTDNVKSSIVLYYLSRLLGFLAVFSLLFFISKKIPNSWLWILILCSPLFWQQSLGVSADNVVFLFLALHLLIRVNIDLRQSSVMKVLWVLLGLGLVSNKPTLLPLLLVLISYEFFQKRDRFYFFGLILLSVTSVIWALRDPGTFEVATSNINASRQIAFILENPWGTLRAFWRSMRSILWPEAWIGPLGYLEAPLAKPFTLFWTIVWVLGLGYSIYRSSYQNRLTAILGFIALLGVGLASALAMYLSFSPVGHDRVLGLQGRYLLPVLLVIPIFVAEKPMKFSRYSWVVATVSIFFTFQALWLRYFAF